MTLLSIREQEAVNATGCVLWQTISDLRDDDVIERALEARDRTLILATRDAIARQVREEADAAKLHARRYCFSAVATFIEGLDV